MKKFFPPLVISLLCSVLLCSCGSSVSLVPESNPSKWKEYTTEFDGYEVKYKYPGADKKTEYQWYKKTIDTLPLKDKDFVHFLILRYDLWRDIYHFEIGLSLTKIKDKYRKLFKNLSAVENFQEFQKKLFKDQFKNRKYEIETVDLRTSKYIHVFSYNKDTRTFNELYSIPVTKDYFLIITAQYFKEGSFDDAWLASRREIFKKFAENVNLIKLGKNDRK